MAQIQLKRSLNDPSPTPTGAATLKAYDQKGNVVYVERGKYYPGVSMTAPKMNVNPATVMPGQNASAYPSSGAPSFLPTGSQAAEPTEQATAFNSLLLDSLKAAQGVSTIDLLKKRRDLERAQNQAVSEQTPEELRTMSPSMQSNLRQSKAATYSGELDDNAYQIAKAEKAISNFEDIFYKAQQFGQEFIDKMVLPEDMIKNYKMLIEADPERMTTILSTLNDKSKQAVLGALDYTKLAPKSDLSKRNVQVIGEHFDENTQQNVKEYGYFNEDGSLTRMNGLPGGAPVVPGGPEDPVVQESVASFKEWIGTFGGTITQDFNTPVSYFKDGRTTHSAYDIAGKMGDAITSPVSGKVISVTKAEDGSGWGNSLVLEDTNGNTWRMSHFDALAVRVGDTVAAGSQSVGYLGNTGFVLKGDGSKPTAEQLAKGAGTHLHIEAKDKSGKFIDIGGTGGLTKKNYTDKQMQTAIDMMDPRSALTLDGIKQADRIGVNAAMNELKAKAMAEGDIFGVMRASAGGPKVGQTDVQMLAKMGTAYDQLNSLKKELDNLAAKGGTGAFKGRITDKAFWNADVATLRAKLQAIVPTVARGIFGEVGVLTDADIENYKQTIPNAKTPTEAVDRIMASLMETIQSKILNTYSSYANAGYDVSGYAADFKKLNDSIESMSGGSDLRSKVAALGYNYDAMKADGLDDNEIKQALNIQ